MARVSQTRDGSRAPFRRKREPNDFDRRVELVRHGLALKLESGGETMFDDKAIDRHFQGTENLIRSTQRKLWTAFKWIGAAVFILVLAALFVAWKIWGS